MFPRRLFVQLQKVRLEWPKLLSALVSLQFLSMLLLTSQQTLMPLLVRSASKNSAFIASTSVFVMEILKIGTCVAGIFFEEGGRSKQFKGRLKEEIWYKRTESLKVGVPAFVYALQNNLYYIALANIDATAYSVTYQLRILTTALLSVSLLKHRLSSRQWLALFFSLLGVAAVQLDGSTTSPAQWKSLSVGVSATVAMCWTSAFAGVYFEKMLKQPNANMWTQNLRLSLMTLLFAGGGMAINDGGHIISGGFLQGWTPLVWLITGINAVGGLAVSLVMKHAGNVRKTYCQTTAIAVLTVSFGDREATPLLVVGVGLVLVSVYVYAMYPAKEKKGTLKDETV